MRLAFDPVKDEINREKHGCSLALAREFEWETATIWQDVRFDYGEDRFVGLGYISARIYVVIFFDRTRERRIISLRKANARERKIYA